MTSDHIFVFTFVTEPMNTTFNISFSITNNIVNSQHTLTNLNDQNSGFKIKYWYLKSVSYKFKIIKLSTVKSINTV